MNELALHLLRRDITDTDEALIELLGSGAVIKVSVGYLRDLQRQARLGRMVQNMPQFSQLEHDVDSWLFEGFEPYDYQYHGEGASAEEALAAGGVSDEIGHQPGKEIHGLQR